MTVKYYSNKSEWEKLKKEANAKGESTIHDDFLDINDKPTDGQSGRLTFDIIPDIIDPTFTRKKELRAKIKNDTITFVEMKEWLRLDLNL